MEIENDLQVKIWARLQGFIALFVYYLFTFFFVGQMATFIAGRSIMKTAASSIVSLMKEAFPHVHRLLHFYNHGLPTKPDLIEASVDGDSRTLESEAAVDAEKQHRDNQPEDGKLTLAQESVPAEPSGDRVGGNPENRPAMMDVGAFGDLFGKRQSQVDFFPFFLVEPFTALST